MRCSLCLCFCMFLNGVNWVFVLFVVYRVMLHGLLYDLLSVFLLGVMMYGLSVVACCWMLECEFV